MRINVSHVNNAAEKEALIKTQAYQSILFFCLQILNTKKILDIIIIALRNNHLFNLFILKIVRPSKTY